MTAKKTAEIHWIFFSTTAQNSGIEIERFFWRSTDTNKNVWVAA
jgi:hypothetical protein